MKTSPVTHQDLRRSVIAVPPLARRADLSLNEAANRALLAHLEAGGVRSVMYGGNANFYNVGLGEYARIVDMLAALAGPDTWILPSAGPDYGKMMDQAAVLRTRAFPTAMLLPMSFPYTDDGLADGVRRFTDALAKPAVVYIKSAGYLAPATVARLIEEGRIVALKYAVVRGSAARRLPARAAGRGRGALDRQRHRRAAGHRALPAFRPVELHVRLGLRGAAGFHAPAAAAGRGALRRGRQRAPALPGSGGLPRRHQPHPRAARCGDTGRRGRHGADAALADGAVRRRTRTRGAGGARWPRGTGETMAA